MKHCYKEGFRQGKYEDNRGVVFLRYYVKAILYIRLNIRLEREAPNKTVKTVDYIPKSFLFNRFCPPALHRGHGDNPPSYPPKGT